MQDRLVFVEYVLVAESPSWQVSRSDPTPGVLRSDAERNSPLLADFRIFWIKNANGAVRRRLPSLARKEKKKERTQVYTWWGEEREGLVDVEFSIFSGWCLKSGCQGGYRICVAHSWCAAHSCEDYISRRANFSSGASRNRTYITK